MVFRYRYLIDFCIGMFIALGIIATLSAPQVNTLSIRAAALAVWSGIIAFYIGAREAARQEYESNL